jgi:hypothetical protein
MAGRCRMVTRTAPFIKRASVVARDRYAPTADHIAHAWVVHKTCAERGECRDTVVEYAWFTCARGPSRTDRGIVVR